MGERLIWKRDRVALRERQKFVRELLHSEGAFVHKQAYLAVSGHDAVLHKPPWRLIHGDVVLICGRHRHKVQTDKQSARA